MPPTNKQKATMKEHCERDKKKLEEMATKLATMAPAEKKKYDDLANKYVLNCVKITGKLIGTGFRGGSRRYKKKTSNKTRHN